MRPRMSIDEDDRATSIWNDLIDSIDGDVIDTKRDWLKLQDAFTKLRALGYSKQDANDFLNANLSELDPAQ